MKGDKVKFGVVVFPGSNCDHDAYHAVKHVSGQEVEFLWHKESNLRDADVIILPGGFSYGDYLRCGAISQFSSIMKEVVRFANDGGYVIGICNGFQILTETGLLKGALLRNASLQFVCKTVELSVANASTAFSSGYTDGEVLRIPVAHGEGNFYTDRETLKALEDNRQVVFRYSDNSGNPTRESNPNGSVNNIAGIINEKGNVLGMMPHPERAMEHILGSIDGLNVFESLVSSIAGSVPASA